MQAGSIRNFSIIAHIDHGKSTLADRLIEFTGTVSKNEMMEQLLDDMDLERERGITIKAHAIRMIYERGGKEYLLNMIDTPGHVDFTYEVSRSLAACEGAILVVDASQGIEAQTLSNLYLAIDNNLAIIPVINKIDLPGANPDAVAHSIGDLLGYDPDRIPRISAKAGLNIGEVLERIVDEVPPPKGDSSAPLKALIFDSVYDSYRGVISYVRIMEGSLKAGTKIRMMKTGGEYAVTEVGTFSMKRDPRPTLDAGMVGYVLANIKTLSDVKIGDTLTDTANPAAEPLAGYKEVKPMIFSGIYPINPEDYKNLREALEKLKLNDSALVWEPESSGALGFGFRTGFLGLLHMEIVQERLDREFNVDIITTVPNVEYRVFMTSGEMIPIESPSKLPDPSRYDHIKEPYIKAQIFTPKDYIGSLMQLAEEKRGTFETMEYLDENKVILRYELPLAEVMFDFYDRLKSVSRGYAGLDYEQAGYRANPLVKLDILLNGDPVDAFSVIIHREKAQHYAQAICTRLKDLIPRQQFDVAIQGAIGGKIISRTTVKAVRRDVLAKCYGGDITRKRKLLEKQKEGKKRMKSIGSVEVPQKAFLAVLSLSSPSGQSGDDED
ncbi:MAG: translation elongation factor 4 [Candidatus Fibromonas sp.]|jgi:GTP-binding protein LepA|nr:translation elongation factor 4 [Candidatus Fibromonas sp.]